MVERADEDGRIDYLRDELRPRASRGLHEGAIKFHGGNTKAENINLVARGKRKNPPCTWTRRYAKMERQSHAR